MDPPATPAHPAEHRFPRTRGDGPHAPIRPGRALQFPPHARGWTLRRLEGHGGGSVSPARAGMDLKPSSAAAIRFGFPRTRGDGPLPRNRSSTMTLFPPHARGWTRGVRLRRRARGVSPARAGMDPARLPVAGDMWRFPRTRGDGPIGLIPLPPHASFPPHARGWTRPLWAAALRGGVSPARAGMDPAGAMLEKTRHRFPRTRGDGPVRGEGGMDDHAFPPHARGWTVSNS